MGVVTHAKRQDIFPKKEQLMGLRDIKENKAENWPWKGRPVGTIWEARQKPKGRREQGDSLERKRRLEGCRSLY